MAADFLSLISSIPGLISDFGGGGSAPYLKQQQQLAQQQMGISQALTQGPNNPLYQQLYGQYQKQGAQQLGQGVSEIQAQNRLNSSMGRTPLLNDERGSENIFRNIMQGYQGLGTQADQQTRQSLQGAMVGTNAAATDYNNLSKFGGAANAQQLQGYSGIESLLRGLGGNNQNNGTQSPESSGGYYGQMMNQNYTQPNANNFYQGQQGYGLRPQQTMYQPQVNNYR